MKKRSVSIAVALLILAGAMLFYLRGLSPLDHSTGAGTSASETAVPDAGGGTSAGGDLEAGDVGPSGTPSGPPSGPQIAQSLAELESWADALPLTDREKKLKEAFGASPLGTRMSRMLIVSSLFAGHRQEGEPALDAFQREYSESYMNDPEGAAQVVELGLSALSTDEFGLERGALIGTLTTLPGKQALARSKALEEMTRSAPAARPWNLDEMTEGEKDQALDSSNPRYLRPILAHAYFLDVADGYEDALRGTREALDVQKDRMVRTAIRRQLIEKYPEKKVEIRKEFSSLDGNPGN